MEKIKKYRYEVLLFIVESICMTLELVAARVLAPTFGNSNVIWTSIIAVILLSASIGNLVGGKIADKDKKENETSLVFVLAIAAFFIFIIAIGENAIISTISSIIPSLKLGAIISTASLFLVPSIFFGIIPPIILKLKLNNLNSAGNTSGRITAISTVGGIFGTILSGFWLVPNIGSVKILYFLSLITLLLVFLVDSKKTIKLIIVIAILSLLNIIGLLSSINKEKTNEQLVLEGNNEIQLSFDTEYARILVYNGIMADQNKQVRVFNSNSGFESAMYLEKGKENDLCFDYLKAYDLVFNYSGDINETLMIGGAGFSYPRYFVYKYPDKKIDVVEIDEKVIEIAKKYFNLDNVLNDKKINAKERLNVICNDGRIYLNTCSKKYDAIMNDAFLGLTPPASLTTLEAIQNVKKCLNEGGIYAINVVGSLEGRDSRFFRAEINTLKQVFNNVYIIPIYDEVDEEIDLNRYRNISVFATDSTLNLDGLYDLKIDENEIVLTDDYCPVESLTDYDIKK